jgi:hypothetical protein
MPTARRGLALAKKAETTNYTDHTNNEMSRRLRRRSFSLVPSPSSPAPPREGGSPLLNRFMTKRTLLALMALALLITGIVLALAHADGAAAMEIRASCFRLSVLCCLIWLAYPELMKLPTWLFPAIACIALAAYRWPRLLWLVPILAAGGWLLKPRGKRRPAASRSAARQSSRSQD